MGGHCIKSRGARSPRSSGGWRRSPAWQQLVTDRQHRVLSGSADLCLHHNKCATRCNRTSVRYVRCTIRHLYPNALEHPCTLSCIRYAVQARHRLLTAANLMFTPSFLSQGHQLLLTPTCRMCQHVTSANTQHDVPCSHVAATHVRHIRGIISAHLCLQGVI